MPPETAHRRKRHRAPKDTLAPTNARAVLWATSAVLAGLVYLGFHGTYLREFTQSAKHCLDLVGAKGELYDLSKFIFNEEGDLIGVPSAWTAAAEYLKRNKSISMDMLTKLANLETATKDAFFGENIFFVGAAWAPFWFNLAAAGGSVALAGAGEVCARRDKNTRKEMTVKKVVTLLVSLGGTIWTAIDANHAAKTAIKGASAAIGSTNALVVAAASAPGTEGAEAGTAAAVANNGTCTQTHPGLNIAGLPLGIMVFIAMTILIFSMAFFNNISQSISLKLNGYKTAKEGRRGGEEEGLTEYTDEEDPGLGDIDDPTGLDADGAVDAVRATNYTAETLLKALDDGVRFDAHEVAKLVKFLQHGAKWDVDQAARLLHHADRIAGHLNRFLGHGVEVDISHLKHLFKHASDALDHEAFNFLHSVSHTLSQLDSDVVHAFGDAASGLHNAAITVGREATTGAADVGKAVEGCCEGHGDAGCCDDPGDPVDCFDGCDP